MIFIIFTKDNFLKFNYLLYLVILTTLIILFAFNPTIFAFSDIEKDIGTSNLNYYMEEYDLVEFEKGSIPNQIISNLQDSITDPYFENVDYKLYYVNDETINAYYIGNGYILLFKGLIDELETEDQLAAVIAHEIGHSYSKHLEKNINRSIGLALFNLALNEFTDKEYEDAINVFDNLIQKGYSRSEEKEADIYAVNLMAKSGYNPKGLVNTMNMFKKWDADSKLIEFTRTHPIPDTRINYIKKYVENNKNKLVEIDKVKLNSGKNKVGFNYPKKWNLIEESNSFHNKILVFKSDEMNGEILFKDLSQETFLQNAKKRFFYSKINYEENGLETESKDYEKGDLEVYYLKVNGDNEKEIIEYFISEKNKQQVLKFKFVAENLSSDNNNLLINRIIDSVEFGINIDEHKETSNNRVSKPEKYKQQFKVLDITGKPIKKAVVKINGNELEKNGDLYKASLNQGTYDLNVQDFSNNYMGYSKKISVNQNSKMDIYLVSYLNKTYSVGQFGASEPAFKMAYPADWQSETINGVEIFSHPDSDYPLLSLTYKEYEENLDEKTFKKLLSNTQYDNVIDEKVVILDNYAYQFEIDNKEINSKLFLLITYAKNKVFLINYYDNEEKFDSRKAVFNNIKKSIELN